MKRAIVFDLDGTLIDSAGGIRVAVNKMLLELGQAPLDLATITGFIGHGLPMLVSRVITFSGLDPAQQDDLTAQVIAHYNADPLAETTLYPVVESTIRLLKQNGFLLGICTNKPIITTQGILAETGLEPYFDVVLGGDSLRQRKPDPAPLIEAFKRLKSQGLYVGDSEVDAETAQRAGIDFALFTEGYRKTPINELPHRFAFSHYDALGDYIARTM